MAALSRVEWCYRCAGCGTCASTLPVYIDGTHTMDEGLREEGLSAIRTANFATVLDRLDDVGVPGGSRLLDVGCAHGWFLEAAEQRGTPLRESNLTSTSRDYRAPRV